jgi:hypothetical protein
MSVHFTKENVFANSFLLTKQNTITYTWTKHNDDMDKISEGKDPTAFLLDTSEKSKEDDNWVRLLVWN